MHICGQSNIQRRGPSANAFQVIGMGWGLKVGGSCGLSHAQPAGCMVLRRVLARHSSFACRGVFGTVDRIYIETLMVHSAVNDVQKLTYTTVF